MLIATCDALLDLAVNEWAREENPSGASRWPVRLKEHSSHSRLSARS